MAWEAFEESFVHTEGHRVMGRKLKPFCLHYQFWLEVVDSPILIPGAKISVIDLEIASRICSCSYGKVARIARKRPGRIQKWWFAIRAIRTDVRRELEKLDAYLVDYSRPPERLDEPDLDKNGRPRHDFPPTLAVATCLMALGFENGDEKKIWTAPLGKMHWYAASYLRLQGADLKLVTDHDREFMEGIRKLRKLEALKASKPKD